jgi:hypothetical protein
MDQENRKKKSEIFNKIVELVKIAGALGDSTEDEQTMFLAESIKVVLAAGSNPESARLLSDHLVNYIEEEQMSQGVTKARDHLKEKQLILN